LTSCGHGGGGYFQTSSTWQCSLYKMTNLYLFETLLFSLK
jgi:hypothetical protein